VGGGELVCDGVVCVSGRERAARTASRSAATERRTSSKTAAAVGISVGERVSLTNDGTMKYPAP